MSAASGVQELTATVGRFIAEQGGDLVGADRETSATAGALWAKARRIVEPGPGPSWLSPGAAGVKYSEVPRTASDKVALVHVSGHRRGGSSRRCWFGVDVLTGREVRIRSVLAGWKR